MSLFSTVLQALAPLFLLIVLGYVLKRYARILHVHHVPIFNGLVINVTLPSLIFLALIKTPALTSAYEKLPPALFAAEMVTMATIFGLGSVLRMPRQTVGMLMMTGVFGNTAFLGYPITLALMPKMFPAAVLLDQFGMTIIMLLFAVLIGGLYGSSAASAADRRAALLRFARSPMLIAALGGIAIRLIPWPEELLAAPGLKVVGKVIAQCLGYLGQGTTPLALLALGAVLRPRAAAASVRVLALPCFFKLLLCPLLMFLFCRLIHINGEYLRVGLLESAMPTSVTASVLCAQNDLEGELAGGVAFATTVLSLITIPILLFLLQGNLLSGMLK